MDPPSATFDSRMVNFTNRDLIRDKQMGSMLHRLGYNIYNQKLDYKNHDTPIHRGTVYENWWHINGCHMVHNMSDRNPLRLSGPLKPLTAWR